MADPVGHYGVGWTRKKKILQRVFFFLQILHTDSVEVTRLKEKPPPKALLRSFSV